MDRMVQVPATVTIIGHLPRRAAPSRFPALPALQNNELDITNLITIFAHAWPAVVSVVCWTGFGRGASETANTG